jgi:hypothetical protein
MKTKIKKQSGLKHLSLITLILISIIAISSQKSFAHCDSYDGPVVQDAYKALETNNVSLVLKWVSESQESEIVSLFNKTYKLKTGDSEIYEIVEKHFFETLVRLHRETEGAPYTGLKHAGTTKKIIVMSDKAIESGSIDNLLKNFNDHIEMVIREKYNQVLALEKVKNESVEKGRAYVKAYVEYTHLLEGIHDMIEHGAGHGAHNH